VRGIWLTGAFLQEGTDSAFFFDDLQKAVAGSLAPDGHVFEDRRVVADDLQEVSRFQPFHLAGSQEDGEWAEGTGDVEAAWGGRAGGEVHGFLPLGRATWPPIRENRPGALGVRLISVQ
jgi:hypothetical protein